MNIKRQGSAAWSGTIKEGKGHLSTTSGALTNYPYGFQSRFGNLKGTNPEELLGAAHAGCFTMALSLILAEAGVTADSLSTKAEVTLEQVDSTFAINAVHLTVEGKVPGIDAPTFEKLANAAKTSCPVSKLLRAAITMDVLFIS